MSRKVKKGIPKEAIQPLVEACETYSEYTKEPASKYFEYFLGLMKRYEGYFFAEPWPKDYDHHQALDITQDDVDFLFGGDKDFRERLTTICLKKNMFLKGGFMGYWGMVWTRRAIQEVVFHPFYEEVFDEFQSLVHEGRALGDILVALKKEYKAKTIHDSLVDFLRHNCPGEETRGLVDGMLELLHSAEGVPSCGDDHCCWYWRTEYGDIKKP